VTVFAQIINLQASVIGYVYGWSNSAKQKANARSLL
jgi:hypothetical protein